MPDESVWAYTVRVGYSDEQGQWVAQVLDEIGEPVHTVAAESLQQALGLASAAVMEVQSDEEDVEK